MCVRVCVCVCVLIVIQRTMKTLQLAFNHGHSHRVSILCWGEHHIYRYHIHAQHHDVHHVQGVGALYIVMDALKRRRAEEKEKAER